jgi:hypothetical protein
LRVTWNEPIDESGVTPYEIAQQMQAEGHTWVNIGKRFGASPDAVRKAMKQSAPVIPNSVMPVFPDKVLSTVTWRDALCDAKVIQKIKEKFKEDQDEATANVKCDMPIVVYTSDWHLGSLATDHEHLMRWLEMVLGTENVYLVCVGLDIESRGHFRSILPTLQQVYSPDEQRVIFEQIWQELTTNGKLLASCWDNHSIEQYEKLIGYSPIENMQKKEIPYFKGMGTLHLRVGKNLEQTYDHFVSHNTRFGSSFNLTHGLKQTARMQGFTGELVVAGHIHNPDIEWTGDRAFVRTGTFKTADDYSQRYWGQGKFACPCAVFHADRHEFVPFWTVDQALAYRRGLTG